MTRKSIPGKSARRPKMARTATTSARPLRTKKPDTIESLMAASAQTLALPIDPAWRSGIKLNLQLILIHAARVDEFSLPDETEPAPVFRA